MVTSLKIQNIFHVNFYNSIVFYIDINILNIVFLRFYFVKHFFNYYFKH